MEQKVMALVVEKLAGICRMLAEQLLALTLATPENLRTLLCLPFLIPPLKRTKRVIYAATANAYTALGFVANS
jgi:hypothetical protein